MSILYINKFGATYPCLKWASLVAQGDGGLIHGSEYPGEGNSNSIVFQIFWCFQFFTYKYYSGNICLCTFWQFVSLVVFILEMTQVLYIHLHLESKLANCILKKIY